MAITSVASGGNDADTASSTTWAIVLGATLLANEWVVLSISTDNSSATDGDNNEHQSLTGGDGLTWTKLGEHTNANGAAAGGVTVSAWLARNTTGGTIGTLDTTLTMAAAVVDKCCIAWKFAAGVSLAYVTGTLQTSAVDGTNGYGGSTISGLPSVERLYFRALAKEANSSGAITVSSGFTTIGTIRSRNDALAVITRGEFKIATSTGEYSEPVHAVVGDTAGLFFALSEGEPSAGGNPWNYYAQQ
jgi:hypothetical protein